MFSKSEQRLFHRIHSLGAHFLRTAIWVPFRAITLYLAPLLGHGQTTSENTEDIEQSFYNALITFNLPHNLQSVIVAAAPFLTAFVDCRAFVDRRFCHRVVALSGISWIPGVGDISSGTTHNVQNSEEHYSQHEKDLHFLFVWVCPMSTFSTSNQIVTDHRCDRAVGSYMQKLKSIIGS